MPTPPARTRRRYWQLACLAAILLSIAAFTPLVIPVNRYTPMVGGVPLTLWAGFVICVAQVLVAALAIRVHPGPEDATAPD